MKKYLFLIPTLLIMLLNVFSCGQVVFAEESSDTDVSAFYKYHKDPALVKEIFDYLDFRTEKDVEFSGRPHYQDYLYCVYSKKEQTGDYLTGDSDTITFYLCFYDLTNVTFTSDDLHSLSDSKVTEKEFSFTYSSDSYKLTPGASSGYLSYIRYNKLSQFVQRFSTPPNPSESTYYNPDLFLWVVESNVDELFGNDDALNVEVHFKPTLSGEVDRLITDSNGDTSLSNRMRFTLTNNSKFAIQYQLSIDRRSNDNSSPTGIRDNFVFRYCSDSWVYAPSLDSGPDYSNQLPLKLNKASPWHYVPAGESVSVLFNYCQINLIENQEYTVTVSAARCDYDLATECFVSDSEEIFSEMKQINHFEIVYESNFSMVNYSDVKYNPNDRSNGIIPTSSYEDFQRLSFSYNAKENPDGTIDYTSKDVYSDPNSWYNDMSWASPSDYLDPKFPFGSDVSFGSSVSSNFSSLSRNFVSFFGFVNSTFNYFPSIFKTIISLGLSSIIVIGMIKAVFR